MPHGTSPSFARWTERSALVAPVFVAASLVVTVVMREKDGDFAALITFPLAFLAVLFGFLALFGGLLAQERVTGYVRPRWAFWCALLSIAGGFVAGMIASLRAGTGA